MFTILNPVPSTILLMSRLANTAFLLSIVGTAYQFIAPTIVYVLDPNRNYLYSYAGFGLGAPALLGLVVFWAAAQFLKDHKITWPAIISVIATSNLANLIIIIFGTVNPGGFVGSSSISTTGIFTLTLAPVLVLAGGILGIIASIRYSRQDKQTVTLPATSQSKLS